jgi:hypothetical protein
LCSSIAGKGGDWAKLKGLRHSPFFLTPIGILDNRQSLKIQNGQGNKGKRKSTEK